MAAHGGNPLPEETLESIRRNGVALNPVANPDPGPELTPKSVTAGARPDVGPVLPLTSSAKSTIKA